MRKPIRVVSRVNEVYNPDKQEFEHIQHVGLVYSHNNETKIHKLKEHQVRKILPNPKYFNSWSVGETGDAVIDSSDYDFYFEIADTAEEFVNTAVLAESTANTNTVWN